MDVAIDIAVMCRTWLDDLPEAEAVVRRAATGALAETWPDAGSGAELSIVLADDAMVRDLNHRYRGKDKATNVLSFPNDDDDAADGGPALLGDVVLAHGVVTGEAREQGKTLSSHLSHLVVHGVLHLLGLDHEDDAEAEIMEAKEVAILKRLGIDDPYRSALSGDIAPEQEVAET